MRDSLRGSTARLAVLVCSLVVALSVLPGAALAADIGGLPVGQSSADTVVAEGETVTDDLTVSTGDVVVHGTVEGDVTALSGDVRVTGEVTGDVSAAAGSVTVTGDVGGSISAGAGSVDIGDGATVGVDVSAGGGSVQIGENARVEGSVSAGAGSVLVADGATVDGDVSAGGGDADVRGTVDGDVASGQQVVLGPSASVGGDVTHRDGIDRAEGATVSGDIEHREGGWSVGDSDIDVDTDFGLVDGVLPGGLPEPLGLVYWPVLVLVTGAVLVGLFPEFTAEVAGRASTEPVRTGAAGFAALLGIPFLLVAFLISIVGIPIALAGGALFGVAVWCGLAYGEFLVGRRLLAAAGSTNRWAALAVGVVGVEVVALLPLLGGLVKFLVVLVGLGALFLALTGRWRDEEADAGGDPPVAPADPATRA